MAGIGPTIFTLFIVWASFPTWGFIIYPELSEFPDWAWKEVNGTMGNLTDIVTTTAAAILSNTTAALPA